MKRGNTYIFNNYNVEENNLKKNYIFNRELQYYKMKKKKSIHFIFVMSKKVI